MARPVFATMQLLILIPSLLFQVRHCSSRALLNPEIQQQQLVLMAPAAAHPGAEAVAAAIAEDDGQSSARADGDGAAPSWSSSSSMATASPRDEDQQGGGVASSWPHRSASALLAGPGRPLVLLRSELARRFLLAGVVEGGDSAARASCHSSDVHNSGCTPPSEH